MIEVAQPKSGEGWGHLLATPQYNGGDDLSALAGQLDTLLDVMAPDALLGIKQDGRPAAIFTFQQVDAGTCMVHWANDGRVPIGVSLDVLATWMEQRPGVTFLAFIRRPAGLRLLASRGWRLRSHEEQPFMALMVCQSPPIAAAS